MFFNIANANQREGLEKAWGWDFILCEMIVIYSQLIWWGEGLGHALESLSFELLPLVNP